MGASGNRDSQLATRSVLEDFTGYLDRQFVPKRDKCAGDSGYNISVEGTYRPVRVGWGIPKDHG